MTDDEHDIKQQCAELITAFCYHVDHHQFEQALALFTEDALFARPDLTAKGKAEIAAIWEGRPASFITRHVVGEPFFTEINATTARAVTGGFLYHAQHEGPGVPTIKGPAMMAEFHDTFQLTDAGWKIAERKGVPVFLFAQ